MRLQWHLGTLAKTESKKKKRVNENHFDNHREQKRKRILKTKKKEIHEHKLSNKTGEQSTGRQVLPS